MRVATEVPIDGKDMRSLFMTLVLICGTSAGTSLQAASAANERAVMTAALELYFNLMHGGTGVAFPESRRPVLLHHETISPSAEQLRVRVASPANRDAARAYARLATDDLIERLLRRSSRPRKVQFAPDFFALSEARRGACGPEYDDARFTDAVAVSRAVFHDRKGALIYLEYPGGARAYHAVLTNGAWKIDWHVELWACG